MKARRKTAGFTLLELMVALAIGGFTLTSLYAIGSASTRVFRYQNEIANTQSSLRVAMEQVKRDIARAGYMSTPGAALQREGNNITCGATGTTTIGAPLHAPGSSGHLAAISRFVDNVTLVADVNDATDPTGDNAANGFTQDEIVLVGNYATASAYNIDFAREVPGEIRLKKSFLSFRRDFNDWWNGNPATLNTQDFDEAFTVGRAVRVHMTDGRHYFATFSAVDAQSGLLPVKLTLTNPVPNECDIDKGQVAPLSFMRYWVRNATGAEAERFTGTTGKVGQLLRTEVLPGDKVTALNITGTAIPNQRVVLDYVVAFNLDFVMTAGTGGGNPDDYEVGQVLTASVQSSVMNNPERVRAIRVTLATRTPEQNEHFPWDTGLCANLGCFRVFDDRPGAARVRVARAEVFLPNIAYEGF